MFWRDVCSCPAIPSQSLDVALVFRGMALALRVVARSLPMTKVRDRAW
jgi:hypothetical protein